MPTCCVGVLSCVVLCCLSIDTEESGDFMFGNSIPLRSNLQCHDAFIGITKSRERGGIEAFATSRHSSALVGASSFASNFFSMTWVFQH